jgi:hypothetical protein
MPTKVLVWNLTNLVLFSFILSNQSTGGTILGQYTLSYAAGIAASFLLISAVVF